jgi:hypothetical protein
VTVHVVIVHEPEQPTRVLGVYSNVDSAAKAIEQHRDPGASFDLTSEEVVG